MENVSTIRHFNKIYRKSKWAIRTIYEEVLPKGHSSMTTSEQSIKEVAPIFRFCAQSLYYPEKEWLTDNYFTGLYTLLDSLGAQKEKESLCEMQNSDNLLEELQVEYTHLFINAATGTAAPPYGSVYLDKSLAGKYTEKVHLFYKESGYNLPARNDFPDNIVYQLEYMSFLALEENTERLQIFQMRFFLLWFQQFAARVREKATMPFYPVIVSLIDFFTKEEEYGI